MATEVLRPQNVLLPSTAQQRVRAMTRQRATTNQSAAARARPTLAAGRRHQGRAKRTTAARPAAAVEVYAGPAFSVSPEPSSLPLPQFPFRKAAAAAAVIDDAATRDLRRMLRLE
ncbi:hypothetical protein E2562_013601 [Oryza meyeriana var. granulata]|uniref:Uncharacterized protein n=1 Tax=Oryza meyeriana var. granulata TaxID=110450 RepID=A0A6G1C5R3_9ORYZ|nr:hypothetical protein E2562_013601 [Oryza meyeriana var. granulata]